MYGVQLDVVDSQLPRQQRPVRRRRPGIANGFDPITLRRNEFTGNDTLDSGGGAKIASCDTLTVTDNVFAENTVESDDGVSGRGRRPLGRRLLLRRRARPARQRAAGPPNAVLEQSGNMFRANVLEIASEDVGEGARRVVNNVSLTSTDDTFHANKAVGNGDGSGGGLRYEDGEGAVAAQLRRHRELAAGGGTAAAACPSTPTAPR